ncbi:SPOR domain-containing protein [Comamonas thiooxydans]|uniref:SPOR domain-containing protein n=1 Tax=Comamonas thiooxydans TaxID=363952 RepID=UPI000A2E4A11|nr:SPOR domain-containing protein [Comamonas thiooxydans]BDR08081.1 SPOR domain-containing protein [Comamonas thiooxydans]
MAFFNFRWPGKKDEAESVAGAKRPSRLAQGESVEAMRRRARHRLIGAAVLVLIGVVGFPLLFDTQPRPIPVNIPIEIPDQANSAPEVVPGAHVASQTAAPSGRVAANASLDDGEEVLAPSARPAVPAATAPAVGAAVTAAAVGTAAAVASQVKPEPKPEVKPLPKPEPKPEVKPERKPESKPEKPKAEVKPEVKPEIKKPEAKPEPKHKPEAPKVDEAARARALLEGRSTSEAAPAKEAAATNERFIVQIGAFAEVGKANEIKGKLGAGAFTQTVDTKDGKRTRVRMGPFKSREEAEKAAARAKSLGLPASVFKA